MLAVPIATTASLSWQNKKIYVYTNPHTYTHIYINILYKIICIYIKLNIGSCWCLQHQSISIDNFIFLPCLPVTSHSNREVPDCCHHRLLNCSIPVYIRIVNLYPKEKQFDIQFLLPLVLYRPLICTVTYVSTISSTSISEIVSYICNTVRLFWHILHSVLGFLTS